jgi:Cytochrome c7 and related cytochrome c
VAQIFPERMNQLPLVLGVSLPLGLIGAIAFIWYYFSPWYTDVGYQPIQPVAYSHRLHAGDMEINCRYCHAMVEISPAAGVPPTHTCMNCHTLAKKDSPLLQPIRDSASSNFPMRWVRVHELPDFVYFEHAAHVKAGVGCVSCHGRVDQMEVVHQEKPLSMGWCLDCHRDPGPNLRPVDQVTNMRWVPPANQAQWAQQTIAERHIQPPVDCSGCHR